MEATTLPQRKFLASDSRPHSDEFGFLSTDSAQQTQTILELLAFPVNLIVAPPWTGKTFVTKQLHNHLRTHSGQAGPLAFGQYFHVTIFEAFGMGCEAEPHWWNEWTQIGGSACWIVDGLDEDHRKGHDRALSILERLDALSKERLHELRILFFCRENEVPPKFQTRLVEILEDTRLQQSQLAPMDAAAAREYIASEEKFSHVCQLISANHLQALAAFPVVLNCLMEREPESALNYADILKSVVIELLKDKNREEEATFSLMPLQDRFDAATRIATVLTIGGYDELACDSSLVHNPQLDDVFPSTSQNSRNLRTAAHQSLLSSAFQRTATGYRFRQFHIQEWLTAFELNAYPLARLRPLLVDPFGKPRNDLREVFGLLAAITRDDEVQAWIHEMHGGIPPRSNAAPWTVDHAIKALDRLQAITETTKFGLRFGRTQGLERIAAPGLGDVLKQRIANAELTLAVRELLIDIAIATNARETVETALQLVRSASEDPNLRQSAAILVSRLGTNEELKETGEWIKQIKFQSSTERDIAASLIYAFQDRGIWDFTACVRYAPREETRGSFSSTLWYSLESQMSFENARELLAIVALQRKWALLKIDAESFGERGINSLISKAIALMEAKPDLSNSDYDLLVLLALSLQCGHDTPTWTEKIIPIIAKCETARRKLFMKWLDADETSNTADDRGYRWLMRADDIDWLIEQAHMFAERCPWMWKDILHLACDESVSKIDRRRIRKQVRHVAPATVADFDSRRRRHLAHEKRRRLRREKRQSRIEQFTLDNVVKATLNTRRITLHERMVRLTWFCFEEAGHRPTNVNGDWSDLDSHTRSQVYSVCSRALLKCRPTPIPEGSSFPSTVIYEGTCFVRALTDPSWNHELTATQIGKWLQAGLIFTKEGQDEAISACFNANGPKTESVVLKEARRELRSGSEHVSALTMIPAECWSAKLSAQTSKFVSCEDYPLAARITLLNLLASRSASHALEIAIKWRRWKTGPREARKRRRGAALSVLIALDPIAGIRELEKETKENGKQAFLDTSSLHDYRTGQFTRILEWPTEQLVRLARMLHEAFPVKEDPAIIPGQGYALTLERELRILRGRIPEVLMKRGSDSDIAALNQLAEQFESVREWREYEDANRNAHDLVERLGQATRLNISAIDKFPIGELIKLLENARYRLIRTPEDLQAILLEELDLIGRDASEHVHMLYTPRKKPNQRRLEEDALQAYIKCRLGDRLPETVLGEGTNVILNREPLATGDQRVDIKVQAPTLQGNIATVVIEIKWSSNPTVSTGLVSQLGEDYLKRQNLTHGIYLVGWCGPGTWSNSALGKRPRPKDSMQAWAQALNEQARLFSEANSELQVATSVIDLTWPTSGDL